MSEPDDTKRPSVTSDLGGLGPRATQRGTTPPPPRTPTPTPLSVPAERDLIRGTPVPVSLERLVQQLLAAALPLGAPEKFVREILLAGIRVKIDQVLATGTRTGKLVCSQILKVLAAEEEP